MKKYYTIYKINKETNDIENVAEFENRNDASNFLEIGANNLARYVTDNIDDITCKIRYLLNSQYFIMIDKESE